MSFGLTLPGKPGLPTGRQVEDSQVSREVAEQPVGKKSCGEMEDHPHNNLV